MVFLAYFSYLTNYNVHRLGQLNIQDFSLEKFAASSCAFSPAICSLRVSSVARVADFAFSRSSDWARLYTSVMNSSYFTVYLH
ncbi:hypothetical protein [Nostoc sp.]|uniref:hypothetical protein n=1 Tax=Nostoc sp. TaxID=1180 RepID=UPI003FA5C1D1